MEEKKVASTPKQELDCGFAGVLCVELFYKEAPKLTKGALLKELRTRLPKIKPLDGNEDSGLMAFLHPDHTVRYQEGELPAQCLITETDKPPDIAKYKDAIQQSWGFPKCNETVTVCKHTVLVTDILSSRLPYKVRFKLFRDVLVSVVKATPPEAIYWQFSQHFSTPDEFLKDAQSGKENAGVQTAMNVRLFRITNHDEGDTLMDTLGLGALGLHDFQCHYRNLDANDIAKSLYNIGLYTFEKGDVIESGHTIPGLKPDEKWKCQMEASLLEPKREILDVNPGAPNAAGKRK